MSLLTSELGINVDFDIPLAYFGFESTNLVDNAEFATLGAGGVDVFAIWGEVEGSYSTIEQGSVLAADQEIAGTNTVKFTTTSADPTGAWIHGYVYQDIAVTPDTAYKLSFAGKVGGDGQAVSQGRYSIWDLSNSEYIITERRTGLFSAQNWYRTSIYFNAPATCSSVRIYLYQNTAYPNVVAGDNVVEFGKVWLQKRTSVARAPVPAWGGSGSLGSYRHTTSVNIGYDNMAITTTGTEDYIGDWLENGLGRRAIATYGGTVVWEGFVNQVSARLGGSTLTVGPVMGMVNRGQMVYKGVDFSTTPPVTIPGGAVKGEWHDNIDSQGKFGVLEGKITGGEGLADEMAQLLQTIVAASSWPELSQNINIGSSSELAVTVSCLGYGHFLDKYFYSETSIADYQDLDAKILKILSADPNKIFSTSNTYIEPNATQVENYDDTDRSALAQLKELAELGDSDFNRYVFGIFNNRELYYWNVTDREPKYYMTMKNNRILTANRALVQPWEVVPGEWMNIIDIIPGRPAISVDFRSDPKFLFIESVTYTAPYTVAIAGGRASSFRKKIDSLGLGGF